MIVGARGKPQMIVSDNGTEFTSNAVLMRAKDHDVNWHYMAVVASGFGSSSDSRKKISVRQPEKSRHSTNAPSDLGAPSADVVLTSAVA
jgi:hypothetical protein